MFSCEFCEILQSSFFYRTLPVAASASRVFSKSIEDPTSNIFIKTLYIKTLKFYALQFFLFLNLGFVKIQVNSVCLSTGVTVFKKKLIHFDAFNTIFSDTKTEKIMPRLKLTIENYQ